MGIRPRVTLYPQKLVLTSPTSGSRSVGIVRSRTQATESVFVCFFITGLDNVQSATSHNPIGLHGLLQE
jgi:hypothetical protein